mmetsp:Transcript_11088/g.31124  ORF Transcript_11088/g.31124 Transcript_11088/m.31124 type:complete len:253 (-) Transcript_11088:602-1360(-)
MQRVRPETPRLNSMIFQHVVVKTIVVPDLLDIFVFQILAKYLQDLIALVVFSLVICRVYPEHRSRSKVHIWTAVHRQAYHGPLPHRRLYSGIYPGRLRVDRMHHVRQGLQNRYDATGFADALNDCHPLRYQPGRKGARSRPPKSLVSTPRVLLRHLRAHPGRRLPSGHHVQVRQLLPKVPQIVGTTPVGLPNSVPCEIAGVQRHTAVPQCHHRFPLEQALCVFLKFLPIYFTLDLGKVRQQSFHTPKLPNQA